MALSVGGSLVMILACVAVVSAHTLSQGVPPSSKGASKGNIVRCTVQYKDKRPNQVHYIPFAALLDWTDHNQTHNDVKGHKACLGGGRGNHRASPVHVSADLRESKDWKVRARMIGSYVDGEVSIRVDNYRREAVRVKLATENSPSVMVDRKTPVAFTVPPRQTKLALKIKPVTKGTPLNPWRGVTWEWQAEPLVYKQSSRDVVLFSNSVTVIIEHRPKETTIFVVNDRKEVQSPVYFNMDILPTDPTNMVMASDTQKDKVLSHVRAIVAPRSRVKLVSIKPKNILNPWDYGLTFRWSAGNSPKNFFGV